MRVPAGVGVALPPCPVPVDDAVAVDGLAAGLGLPPGVPVAVVDGLGPGVPTTVGDGLPPGPALGVGVGVGIGVGVDVGVGVGGGGSGRIAAAINRA